MGWHNVSSFSSAEKKIAKVESSQVEFCQPFLLPLAGSFLGYFLIIAAFGLLGTWAGSGTNLSLVCSCGCLFGVGEVWNLELKNGCIYVS